MALTPGTHLGPYQITAKIGEGGMGEVYRARDARLDREVAIKVLPDSVAQDPERLIRFEREAKALATLSHPNVAQIYGVDAGAIIMEFVPGETLHGPLPLGTALDYASQLASALEAAHEKGLVHRDLKPGNVMVTPDGVVKVLDFGLAGRAPLPASADLSATLTLPATLAGVIVGTAAYMAPEQATAQPVDKRADIWAFGVVLWEMLTGTRLFEGETVSHVLAAVLTTEPDLSVVPPRVRPLLARCLEKDPKRRLRDIGDAMSLVTASDGARLGAGERFTGARWRRFAVGGWAVAAGLAASLVGLRWFASAARVEGDPAVVRFQVGRASDVYNRTARAFAISPDGKNLAYYAPGSDGPQTLVVRTLATGEVRAVPRSASGVPLGNSLFWSTDSHQLARGTATGAQIFDLTTGSVRPMCECRYVGGSVNQDGTILLGAFGSARGIRRLSIGNSNAVQITNPDPSRGEEDTWPVFLTDGRTFLFTRSTPRLGDATYVATLDGGVARRVLDGSRPIFVPGRDVRSSYLLGFDASGLVAQRFNPETLTVVGEPTLVVKGAVAGSASASGVLATTAASDRPWTIPTWFDRKGESQGQVGQPGFIEATALSPDGRKLAIAENNSGSDQGAATDIWVHDLISGARTRLTFNHGSTPVWSADGKSIAFTSRRGGTNVIFERAADGTGEETPLFPSDTNGWTNDWSSDGRWVIYSTPSGDTVVGNKLWVLPMSPPLERKPAPYLVEAPIQQQAQFSPDGRFVAYGSDQSGTWEIYVRPFPNAADGKWMVSNGGGVEPRWRRDGKELFYFSGQTLMATPVTLRPTFSAGTPVALFNAPVQPGYTADSHRWQVAPDGQRFLLLVDAGKTQSTPLDVIVNWQTLLST